MNAARDATASSFSQVQLSWPRSSRLWITRGKVKFRVGEESSKMDRMIRVRDDVHMTMHRREVTQILTIGREAALIYFFPTGWSTGGGSKIQTSYVQTTEQLGWAKTERINFAVCARSSLRGLADVGRAQPTPFRGRPARPRPPPRRQGIACKRRRLSLSWARNVDVASAPGASGRHEYRLHFIDYKSVVAGR